MRFKNLLAGALAACITLTSASAFAAFDAFLKITDIDGESKDSKHAKEIEVLSFSWGATQAVSKAGGAGGASGKVVMQDFHFVHRFDAASPELFLACATGQHIKEVKLTLRKPKGEAFLKVTLSDVLVSSVAPSGAANGADTAPNEEVKLKYAKIVIEYIPQTGAGKAAPAIKAGYDVSANKKV